MCRTHYDRMKKGGKGPAAGQLASGSAARLSSPKSGARVKAGPAVSPKCSVPGCQRPSFAQGLCQMHYEARHKGLGGPKGGSSLKRLCGIPECSAPHHAKGYCKKHYGMLLRRKGGGGESARYSGLCEIAGCNRVATKNKRCEGHQDVSAVDSKRLLTRSERLVEIHKRHDRMRKEIERIKESLASEREDD
jgi:hypothetical protein